MLFEVICGRRSTDDAQKGMCKIGTIDKSIQILQERQQDLWCTLSLVYKVCVIDFLSRADKEVLW